MNWEILASHNEIYVCPLLFSFRRMSPDVTRSAFEPSWIRRPSDAAGLGIFQQFYRTISKKRWRSHLSLSKLLRRSSVQTRLFRDFVSHWRNRMKSLRVSKDVLFTHGRSLSENRFSIEQLGLDHKPFFGSFGDSSKIANMSSQLYHQTEMKHLDREWRSRRRRRKNWPRRMSNKSMKATNFLETNFRDKKEAEERPFLSTNLSLNVHDERSWR